MDKRTYILRVSGTVKFGDEDSAIEQLLLGLEGTPKDRLELAIQELQEGATDLVVEMEERFDDPRWPRK